MREVDGLGLLGQDLQLAAGLIVTLLEGLEGGGCLATEAEGAGDLSPVELESGAALYTRDGSAGSSETPETPEILGVDDKTQCGKQIFTYGSHYEDVVSWRGREGGVKQCSCWSSERRGLLRQGLASAHVTQFPCSERRTLECRN